MQLGALLCKRAASRFARIKLVLRISGMAALVFVRGTIIGH